VSTDIRLLYVLVTASTTVLMLTILPLWAAIAWLAVWAGVGITYDRWATRLLRRDGMWH
jgi:hypothetical protein